MRQLDVDVLILGGGPAGATAAALLARNRWRVRLVERREKLQPSLGESLPPSSLSVLVRLGLSSVIDSPDHVRTAGLLSAWGDVDLIADDYLVHPHGGGLHVDRHSFDSMLLRRAVAAGADVRMGMRVTGIARGPQGWNVRFAGARPCHARVLVDATGRRRALLGKLGVGTVDEHDLFALAAFLRDGSEGPGEWAVVETVPNGWWYTSVLPDGRRLLLRFGDRPEIASLVRHGHGNLVKIAEEETLHIATRCAGWSPGRLTGRDAGGSRASAPVGDDWWAIGDAAQAFDPLSSQGLTRALSTALDAAWEIDGALSGAVRPREYAAGLARQWATYIIRRDELYRSERRWRTRPFWRTRGA